MSKSVQHHTALIPIQWNPDGNRTVNARDLHDFLGSKKDFTSWIKDRISKYKFNENEDFLIFTQKGEKPGRGRPQKEYHLTIDMAKELAMVEKTAKGKEARQYFIECERQVRERGIERGREKTIKRVYLATGAERALEVLRDFEDMPPKVLYRIFILRQVGMSQKETGKACGVGRDTVRRVERKFGDLGMPSPVGRRAVDDQVRTMFSQKVGRKLAGWR